MKMRLRCISLLRCLTNSSIINLETSVVKHNETFRNFPIGPEARRLISQTSSSSAKPNIHVVAQEKTKTKIVDNQNNILRHEIHEVLSFGNEQNAKRYLQCNDADIHEISKYYFDGRGKGIRPRICLTLADAINNHLFGDDNPNLVSEVMKKQRIWTPAISTWIIICWWKDYQFSHPYLLVKKSSLCKLPL